MVEKIGISYSKLKFEKEIIIEVLVSDSDIGRVIGKNGKTANAIRTLVQASSSLKDGKYVKINIDKF